MKSRSTRVAWVSSVFLVAVISTCGIPSFAAPDSTAVQKEAVAPEKGVVSEQDTADAHEPFYTIRGGLDNARLVFEGTKQGRVAYLGGSITASPGWRDFTYEILKKTFSRNHV